MKRAIVMQGQSGSGKSTYVLEKSASWKEAGKSVIICSADDYFLNSKGEYCFDPSRLGSAHAQSLGKWIHALTSGIDIVISDNTNTTLWELYQYVQTAVALGYEVAVVRCVTSAAVAAERNQHGVPPAAVEAMTARLEKPLSFWACEYVEVSTD